MRRRRGGIFAAAWLVAAAAPLVFGVHTAAASSSRDYQTGQLTFVGFDRQTVTCTVANTSTHDGTAHTASAFGTSTGNGAACTTDDLLTVTVRADDENGETRSGTAQAYNGGVSESMDHAASNVHTTVDVHFADCDPSGGQVCELVVSASPK